MDGYAEEAVQPIITASQGHPLMGLPENVFDGDPDTLWTGFGVGKPGGCWIQCDTHWNRKEKQWPPTSAK